MDGHARALLPLPLATLINRSPCCPLLPLTGCWAEGLGGDACAAQSLTPQGVGGACLWVGGRLLANNVVYVARCVGGTSNGQKLSRAGIPMAHDPDGMLSPIATPPACAKI